jgi:hypothetical protein
MDSSDVEFILKARRQLRAVRWLTVCALVIAAGAFAVSLIFSAHHDALRSVSLGSLLGALLANSDFGPFSGPISRADLIRALEAQINRNPVALMQMLRAHR